MPLAVKWSKEAKTTYDDILSHLKENWSDKEIKDFIYKTESLLLVISYQPYAFKASRYKSIRKAIIGQQNSIFYFVHDSKIVLITFWNNRKDPKKKQILISTR